MMNRQIYPFVTLLAVTFFTGRVLAQSAIVQDGQSRAEIVVSTNPPRMAALAARELQTFLEKISGARLPIVNVPGADPPVKIYVGKSDYTDQLGVTDEGLEYGAFRMVSGPGYLVLLGCDFDYVPEGPIPLDPWPSSIPAAQERWNELTGADWDNPTSRVNKNHHKEFWAFDEGGSLYAVYELLRMLGARWYMPGEIGEVLPELATVTLPSVNRTVEPDFKLRYIHWANYRAGTWDNVIWERRVGFNSVYEFLGVAEFAHGLTHVTASERLKSEHPECYALLNGVRDTAGGHECFSSDTLVDEAVRYCRAVLDHFNVPTVSIYPADGYRQCQCELCAGKSPSELVWTFAERVASEVYQTHPDRLVACGAYTSYKPPPENIDSFSPNLLVTIANCMRPSLDHPQKWDEYREIVEGWLERLAPDHLMRTENNRFSIWNGYVDPVPFPVIHPRAVARDLGALKGISQGEWGEVSRANPGQVWKSPGLDHLNLYVQASYLWDADQEIDTLLEEYYTLFYGPVREEMKAALEFAQANYSRTDQSRSGGKCDPMNVELEVKIALLELLHAARDSAGETVYGERIQVMIDELVPLDSLRPEVLPQAGLTVVDRATGEPVYRAEVRYGEKVRATDYSGVASMDNLEEGVCVFTVTHQAYFPVTDSLVITGDTSLVVALTRKLADLRFEVRDSSGVLADASVSLNGWRLATGSDGMAWYSNQPARHTYRFSVEAAGYGTVTDSLYLELDTTVTVRLRRVTGIGEHGLPGIEVFPNPAGEHLYLTTGREAAAEIRLIHPGGMVMLERKAWYGPDGIDVSEFPPGLYFLEIRTGEQITYRKVILE